MDVDWREHLRWVRVDGRPVNVVDIGAGPAVVFLHGLAGCWQNWLESIPELARDHRVVALDLPGFGASPMPADADLDARLRAHARRAVRDARDRLRDARRQLDGRLRRRRVRDPLRRAGRAAVPDVARRASRWSTCATSATAACARGSRTTSSSGPYWAASKSDRVVRRERLRRALLLLLAAHPERLPSALVAEQAHGAGKPGFADALDAMTGYPIRDRLGEIACPALVVWGELDRLVPLRDAAEFEWLIPQRAQGRLRGHRPPRHARAPDPLQRRPARLPRGAARGAAAVAELATLAK